MGKIQTATEEHHRRPESLGGTNVPSNISFVIPKLHQAWHVLFGNMNSEQICNLINMYWKEEGVTVVCKFINGTETKLRGFHNSKKSSKLIYAWRTLFKDLSFQETIDYINSVWLDPSYHLYIIK